MGHWCDNASALTATPFASPHPVNPPLTPPPPQLALVLAPMVLLIGVILGLHMASYVEIRSTTSPLHDLVGTQDLITYLMQARDDGVGCSLDWIAYLMQARDGGVAGIGWDGMGGGALASGK